MIARYFLLLWAALSLVSGGSARADQFVLFDVTFTYTKDDADNSKPSKSHFYVKGDMLNPKRPKDWTGPADYRNGTVQMDLVIKDGSGGNGHAHKRADPEKFFPTRMRITVVQVSAGAKYDPKLVPNLPEP